MVWNINLYGQRGPSGYEFVQEVVARLKHFHITEVNWRGTWTADPEAQPFLRHDAVIHGPAVYIAQVDETTEEPGTGDDWELWIDWSQVAADLATAQQVLLDTIENRTQAQEAQTESENLLENIETLHNVFSQTYLGALEEHPDPQEFTWGLGSFYYNTTIGQIYIWNGLTHEDPEGEWTDPVVPDAAVTAFNNRTGSIVPEEEDYSDFFYTKAQIDSLAQSLGNDLSSHISDENNPHSVTKAQIGLGDVDNVSAATLRDRSTHTGTQALSTISDAGDAAGLNIGTTAGTVAAGDHSHDHFSATDNPHEVTKAQVGLGNVDNTSDANKPVSTAQQAALDDKLDKTGGTVTDALEADFTGAWKLPVGTEAQRPTGATGLIRFNSSEGQFEGHDGSEWGGLGGGGVFTNFFQSSLQSYSNGGSLTVSHGLGEKPKLYQVIMVCNTANNGYSVGDELLMPMMGDAASSAAKGVNSVASATNVQVFFGSSGWDFLNKGGGARNNATASQWRVLVRAWA